MRINVEDFPVSCGIHRMLLLPVIQASFEYRCIDCGGYVSMGWEEGDAGQSIEVLAKIQMTRLHKVTGQPFEYQGPLVLSQLSEQQVKAFEETSGLDLSSLYGKECKCGGKCPCHRED
jgi:hypothetical protein